MFECVRVCVCMCELKWVHYNATSPWGMLTRDIGHDSARGSGRFSLDTLWPQWPGTAVPTTQGVSRALLGVSALQHRVHTPELRGMGRPAPCTEQGWLAEWLVEWVGC